MEIEALHRAVAALVSSRPDLSVVEANYRIPEETQRWLARLSAIVDRASPLQEQIALRTAIGSHSRMNGQAGVDEIIAVLFRTLYSLELQLPVAAQGSFIAAGNEFDAFAQLAKVLEEAQEETLFIDPYADEVLLTDFAPLVREGVGIRIMGAEGRAKPSLLPAAQRWIGQFGKARPLEVRLAPANMMHDRAIIIDRKRAWIVTQSFKDFAKKAHGSIAQADGEAASLKVAAYEELWRGSEPR